MSASPWYPSRYGVGDVLGAGNELSPERTLAALAIPRTGEVLPLAPVLDNDQNVLQPRLYRQIVLSHGRLADGSQAYEEHLSATMHIGCHVDGLGHVSDGGVFYNGHTAEEIFGVTGLAALGIETARPWVGRGVCLDIAGLHGDAVLPEGYAIGADDFAAACARQEVEVRPGDTVLVHTGWGSLRRSDPDRYHGYEPGPDLDGARWLTDHRVSAAGADNWAFEVIGPGSSPGPVHQHMLPRHGTYLVENVDTAVLAERACAEFLFVMTPLRVAGATGSMVSPVAVL